MCWYDGMPAYVGENLRDKNQPWYTTIMCRVYYTRVLEGSVTLGEGSLTLISPLLMRFGLF